MAMTDGAKGTKGDPIKPIENLCRGSCPCNSFLRCSARPPYGQKVWSVRAKRKQACDSIVFNSANPVANKPLLQTIFQRVANSAKRKNRKTFYVTLQNVTSEPENVMVFPKLSEAQYRAEMAKLYGKMHNAGLFTAFQKSIVLRANMVSNGLQLKSDVYLHETGEVMHDTENLIPYHPKPLGQEWNIDHVQTRAKGGCNRFCNAALLSYNTNVLEKHDDGLGCPCVDALESAADKGEYQTDFEYGGKRVKKYIVCNCADFCNNKHDEADNLPAKPLGTMKHYKLLCSLDDPMVFIPDKSGQLTNRASSICSSGS